MRLDYDCSRDLLLALEDSLQGIVHSDDDFISFSVVHLHNLSEHALLKSYDKANIAYCSMKLVEAGFINAHIAEYDDGVGDIIYFSISYEGHCYLDSIRSPKVWSKIKGTLMDKSLSMTFDIIMQMASKFALSALL